MGNTHGNALLAALEWYVDHGVDEILDGESNDRTQKIGAAYSATIAETLMPPQGANAHADMSAHSAMGAAGAMAGGFADRPQSAAPFLGKSDARVEAVKLAAAANTLAELRAAIESFDGLAVKKTATNMVFCDGNPQASVMLIGEAPGRDEDIQGKPFVGESGQLLDRILASIGLSRAAEDTANAVYLSNVLNWRPPGNRTPNVAELEVSLPFIEKHIMLIRPKILILCGNVAARALLGRDESLSRLRKNWHEYSPRTPEIAQQSGGLSIPAMVTYHPAYLLTTPVQKKAVWADMLGLVRKRNEPF